MREEAAELIRMATGSSSRAKKNLDLRPDQGASQTTTSTSGVASRAALPYHPVALLDEKVSEKRIEGEKGASSLPPLFFVF